MNHDERKKWVSAVAAMLITSLQDAGAASGNPNQTAQGGDAYACMGLNQCKGLSECKSARNVCKGHNGCRGRGFVLTNTENECLEKGGRPALNKRVRSKA